MSPTPRQPLQGWNDLDAGEVSGGARLQADQQQTADQLKEITERLGIQGQTGQITTRGVTVNPGQGIIINQGGIGKTNIQPDGDFFAGRNIELPEGVSFSIFVVAQPYNGEAMEEGDILIGDNSEDKSNIKYDASEGQLQFRNGQTVQVYMDTDGSIKAGGGDVTIDQFGISFANQEGNVSFETTDGNLENVIIYIGSDDHLVLKNAVGGKSIFFDIDDAAHNVWVTEISSSGISLDRGMELYLEAGATPLSSGWFPVLASETWTRTGNHQFTVAGDLTAKYRKGMKVKYSDGSFEYGVIASSSHAAGTTTVNLIPNTDYAMSANSSENYISPIDNPEGFPRSFNYTASVTSSGGSITASTVNAAKWNVSGGRIFVHLKLTITTQGTASGSCVIGTPVTATNDETAYGRENALNGAMLQGVFSGATLAVLTYNNATPFFGSGSVFLLDGNYLF